MKNLHEQFVRLGRERNRITYKLLALLPKIEKLKIYEKQGYGNIYEYAAKIAGLSPGVVQKTLRLDEKLKDKPHLRKAIATRGPNKVAIIAGLATEKNDKDLAEKTEHMSKSALQEYGKEERGKITAKWQVELDENMMFMFLKLKKKFGKNLSNKECLRRILEEMEKNSCKKPKSQPLAKNPKKIPGDFYENPRKIPEEKSENSEKTETRYIRVHQKRNLGDQCSHPGCHRPAKVIHHPDRFSKTQSHENLKPLCKQYHEFAHNGITEPMQPQDHQYRKCRQQALL